MGWNPTSTIRGSTGSTSSPAACTASLQGAAVDFRPVSVLLTPSQTWSVRLFDSVKSPRKLGAQRILEFEQPVGVRSARAQRYPIHKVRESLGADSKAPISHPEPIGLGIPRWSVAGQATLSPASRAGLPRSKPFVGVGPPLSAKGPSKGSVLLRLVGEVNFALASEQRLWPPSTIVPEMLV